MKTIFSLLTFALLTFGFQRAETQSQTETKTEVATAQQIASSDLAFLRQLEGKYPDEVKLFENTIFRQRLRHLTGRQFRFMVRNFNVQTPAEIIDNIFVIFACRAHNCTYTDFIVVYDFTNDILHAGIRKKEQEKIYSEGGDIPAQILQWAGDSGN